jgi:hypothetical protein
MNKGGWIHILEATISVLIVAGVMMSVYSDQSARQDMIMWAGLRHAALFRHIVVSGIRFPCYY